MRITNYSVPNEEQMREIEGRYFIPQEIVDQLAYAANKGKEIIDNITTPSEIGGGSGHQCLQSNIILRHCGSPKATS